LKLDLGATVVALPNKFREPGCEAIKQISPHAYLETEFHIINHRTCIIIVINVN